MAIWNAAKPAKATPIERYLSLRGLLLPSPSSLRFHPSLKHPSGERWPCMVALVTRGTDGEPIAIHRTFLTRDGAAKAPVEPQKMMLGPCRGGAVRLAQAGDMLMFGEGIESCPSAMQSTGRPAWAALSTSGLRTLDLPGGVANDVSTQPLILAAIDGAEEVVDALDQLVERTGEDPGAPFTPLSHALVNGIGSIR